MLTLYKTAFIFSLTTFALALTSSFIASRFNFNGSNAQCGEWFAGAGLVLIGMAIAGAITMIVLGLIKCIWENHNE